MTEQSRETAFNLSWLLLSWGVLCGLFAGGLMSIGEPVSTKSGMIAGAIIGAILFSYGAGWIVWRISGRRKEWGRSTFVIVAALMGLGQIFPFLEKSSLSSAIAISASAMPEQESRARHHIADPNLKPEDVGPIVAELDEELRGKLAVIVGEQGRKFADGIRSFRRIYLFRELSYAAALQTAVRDKTVDLAAVARQRDFDPRRRQCAALITESDRYSAFLDAGAAAMRQELVGVDFERDEVKQVLAGSAKAMNETSANYGPVIESRVRYARAYMRLLDHLEESAERWSANSEGLIEFQTDQDLEKFVAIAAPLDEERKVMQELERLHLQKASDAKEKA